MPGPQPRWSCCLKWEKKIQNWHECLLYTYNRTTVSSPFRKRNITYFRVELSHIFTQGSCQYSSSQGQLNIYLPLHGNRLQQGHFGSSAWLPLKSLDRNGYSSTSQAHWTAHRKIYCCTHPSSSATKPLQPPPSLKYQTATYLHGFIQFKILMVRHSYHGGLPQRGVGLVDKLCYFCKLIIIIESENGMRWKAH